MKQLKGIILCFFLALVASFLGSRLPIVGGAVFAVILGMVLNKPVSKLTWASDGIAFTSKKILQYAVILLGFSMNLKTILASGQESLPVILSTVSISLITAYVLTRALGLDRKIGILVGVGSSICGGSAIAATAPIIDANDEEVAKSISVIFLFNVLAAILFPSLGQWIGLSNQGFGLFAGTAINDTSSVTAAASSWDAIHQSNTLTIATVVKLTRTLAIIPISLVLSFYEGRQSGKKDLKISSLVPSFILLFILASIIRTFIPLPEALILQLKTLSKFFITMAMAAIGLKTNLVHLVKTGGKAILVGMVCWIFITLTSLGGQSLIGIL
ncbi:YeiH family protein [Urinicoccus massiliensis]|uniref:YeiH family protein n=1 Tax=Urinicoccus massiliensis TaxID=1723382 RepID=UPI0009303DC5|nr:YeiH family protein [Urinicoccus massiliensis]